MLGAARAHPRIVAGLVLVTVAGGALRTQAAATPTRYQSVDERAYARLARTLASRGHWGANEMRDPWRWSPAAPALFAVAHRLRPAVRGDGRFDVPSAYPLQAAASTATIPAVYLLAALAAGPAAGIVAAGALAFYPPAIAASGELLTEPLGALGLTLALLAVALALRRPAHGACTAPVALAAERATAAAPSPVRPAPLALLGAGLLLGICVVTRGDLILLPCALALVAGLVVHASGASRLRAAAAGALLVGGALVVLLPWSAFATRGAGRLVPVSTGGGSNLFVGTFLPGDGTMFGLKRELAGEARRRFPGLRAVRPANLPQLRIIDAVAARRPGMHRETALRREALENLRRYALGRPLAFGAMVARKQSRLWLGVTVGSHRRPRAPVQALHLALVACAAGGLLWGLTRRPRVGGPVLWLAAATLLYVGAVNAAFVAEARHNLPVMPVLLAGGAAGAAGAVGALGGRLRAWRSRGRSPSVAAWPGGRR